MCDGKLHGYNRLDLLKIDLATNKPDHYDLFKQENGIALRYVPMTQSDLEEIYNREYQNETNG